MKKSIRKVVVVSDLHCGSTVGLLPRNAKTLEGQRVQPNKAQAWLQDRWDEAMRFVEDATRGEPFALVVNGDTIEGVHHGTKQVCSPEISDHCEWAYQSLMPLAEKAEHLFVTTGTEAHTHSTEHHLAIRMGAVPDKFNDKPAWDELDLTVHGYTIRFTHHISTTSREWLSASRLSIHLANMRLAALDAKHPVPSGLIAGHCHRFDEYHTPGGGLCLTLPSWQFLTRYGHKVVTQSRTHIGLVVLHYSGESGEVPRVATYLRFAQPNPGVRL